MAEPVTDAFGRSRRRAAADTPDATRAARPGLRERKRESTRKSIWESAMRLFADHGYDQVTIEDIADVCMLSPRTIFRYFGTKEDVLFSGTHARHAKMMAALETQPTDIGCFAAIDGACRQVASDYLPELDLLRVRARIIASAPSLQPRNAALPDQWDHDVTDVLRRTGHAGGMSNLELRLVVGAAMSALRVCIDEWISSDDDLLDLIDAAFIRLRTGLADVAPAAPAAAVAPAKRSKRASAGNPKPRKRAALTAMTNGPGS